MSERSESETKIAINRAPVLALWAAVVAERLGFDRDEALTLGRAVSGLNAQSKGRRLGLFHPPGAAEAGKRARERSGGLEVELLGRRIPARRTAAGLRTVGKGGRPDSPEAVERYLVSKFGDALAEARAAMRALAGSRDRATLAAEAFALYEAFRPEVPRGRGGWGAKGVLDLARVRALARRPRG